MAKKKNINQLSAEELFKLAKERQQTEEQEERIALKAELDILRQERRELIAAQHKALAKLDSQIQKLRNKISPTRASHRTGRGGNISSSVLDILTKNKTMSTKQIQQALASQGITANNLSQTLAYLKRQGKVASPQRSVYTIA